MKIPSIDRSDSYKYNPQLRQRCLCVLRMMMNVQNTDRKYNVMKSPLIRGASIRREQNDVSDSVGNCVYNDELLSERNLSISEIFKLSEHPVFITSSSKRNDAWGKRVAVSKSIRRGDRTWLNHDDVKTEPNTSVDDEFFENLMKQMISEQFIENSKNVKQKKRKGTFNVIENMNVYKRFKEEYMNTGSVSNAALAPSTRFTPEESQFPTPHQFKNISESRDYENTRSSYISTLDRMEESILLQSRDDNASSHTRNWVALDEDIFCNETNNPTCGINEIDNTSNESFSLKCTEDLSDDCPGNNFINNSYSLTPIAEERAFHATKTRDFIPIDLTIGHKNPMPVRVPSFPFDEGDYLVTRDQNSFGNRSTLNFTSPEYRNSNENRNFDYVASNDSSFEHSDPKRLCYFSDNNNIWM